MGTTEELIDSITKDFSDLVELYSAELQRDTDELINDVFLPIREPSKKRISGAPAFTALSLCIKRAEKIMAQICSLHGMDFWLTYLRRLPTIKPDWPRDWTVYTTLGVLKWSSREDVSERKDKIEGKLGVAFEFTKVDLLLCGRLATLGMLMQEINIYCRLVGKGASVVCLPNGKVQIDTPSDVEKAVSMYEIRRPESQIFADEGILVIQKPELFLEHPIFALGKPVPPFDQIILNSTGEKIRINYLPNARSVLALQHALLPYDDALQDLFGIDSGKIIQTIEAFTKLVMASIPLPDQPGKLEFNTDISDKLFFHSLSFMVNFYRKGFVRFPLEHLRFSLANSIFASGESFENAKEIINLFFEAFCLKEENRRKIDVRILRPPYILYLSPSGQCYFDLLHLGDFIQWLIVRSREWFSSQHGDRFTLALKTLLNKSASGAEIVSWKTMYPGSNGTKEIDLVVKKGKTLYAVECKAFTKSRDYWLGEPKATASRTSKINKAVNQAKTGAATIEAAINSNSVDIPDIAQVEWVVCSPTQEFIKPWDKYGFLSQDISRVCTPEEFVSHLNREE